MAHRAALSSSEESIVADKSQKSNKNVKKVGKSLQEKRAAKASKGSGTPPLIKPSTGPGA